MPLVKGKSGKTRQFPYTKAGMKDAKAAAKKTGTPMEMAPPPLPPKRGGFKGKKK